MDEDRRLIATLRVYVTGDEDDFSFDAELEEPDGNSIIHVPKPLAVFISKYIGPLLPLLNRHVMQMPDDASEAGAPE